MAFAQVHITVRIMGTLEEDGFMSREIYAPADGRDARKALDDAVRQVRKILKNPAATNQSEDAT